MVGKDWDCCVSLSGISSLASYSAYMTLTASDIFAEPHCRNCQVNWVYEMLKQSRCEAETRQQLCWHHSRVPQKSAMSAAMLLCFQED